MSINPTPKCDSKRGAPMGRPKSGDSTSVPTTAFQLKLIPITSGGYDPGGAYWGTGQPLYFYISYETVQKPYGPCEYCGQHVPFYRVECNSPTGYHVQASREDETEISDYIRADSRAHAKAIVRRLYPTAKFKR